MKRDAGNQHRRRQGALARLETHYGHMKAYWESQEGGANDTQRMRLRFMEQEMKKLRDTLKGVEQ